MRNIFLILLIGGQLGLGILDIVSNNHRTGFVAIMFAMCNYLVFVNVNH